MKNFIVSLTTLITLFAVFSLVNSQTLPMCIAPERYLIWQRAQWGGDRWPAGYMPFAHTATGTLNRSPIFVSGDDNVGIGRIPETKLDIQGGLRALAASFGNTLITGTATITGTTTIIGRVGINTTNPQAPLEVSGVMRLTPMTTKPIAIVGAIYFDNSENKFKCSVKDDRGNPIWQDCGGVGVGVPIEAPEFIKPVKIWESSAKTRLVLEISEE